MLIDAFMSECAIMVKTSAPDTIGGMLNTWAEGEHIMAAIVKDNTLDARKAEKEGVTELYTVTFDKGVTLRLGDVLKRLEDGCIFRVKSNTVDSRTPSVASFQFGQVTAERLVELK